MSFWWILFFPRYAIILPYSCKKRQLVGHLYVSVAHARRWSRYCPEKSNEAGERSRQASLMRSSWGSWGCFVSFCTSICSWASLSPSHQEGKHGMCRPVKDMVRGWQWFSPSAVSLLCLSPAVPSSALFMTLMVFTADNPVISRHAPHVKSVG